MKLEVNFLNNYIIKYDDEHWLDFNMINSYKLAKLLAYLVYNHHRKLNTNDIQELMFTVGESNNPANALKALIYRLRALLKKHIGEYDYILSSKGTYYWNPEIELCFDVEEFVKYYRLGRDEVQNKAARADYYRQAYYKYQGSFLPMIKDSDKLQIIRSYLNSQFLNVVRYLIEFYLDKQEYSVVEEICLAALVDNRLDENINQVLILSLVKQDKITLAKVQLEKILSTLKDNFTDEAIKKMKYCLSLNNKANEEKNILAIQNDLIEDKTQGAYHCDYDFFKRLYQVEVRKSLRCDNNKTLLVITIDPQDYIKDNLEVCNLVFEETSKIMETIVLKILRIGDIVCRYSTKQFLILLDCSIEDTVTVIKRIKNDFDVLDKYDRVNIDFSYIPLINAKVEIDDQDILKIQ